MPTRIRDRAEVVRVVLVSPSDVNSERTIVDEEVQRINRLEAPLRGVFLDLHRWETDAVPAFDVQGPQGQIDRELKIENADLLIGIFWTRRGIGTVHEFEIAYSSWQNNGYPQIAVYFCRKPYNPKTTKEVDQLREVRVFQDSFPKEGMWWEYSDRVQFRKAVAELLTKFLNRSFPVRYPAVEIAVLPGKQKTPAPGSIREEPHRLATGVSRAFWCDPKDVKEPFQPAILQIGEERSQQVDWFDELLHGGLVFPKSATRPLTMLIAGPPGSGKSTLAMEICYRLACNESWPSLYISMEAEAGALIGNARDLGYHNVEGRMRELGADYSQIAGPAVTISGISSATSWDSVADIAKQALRTLNEKMQGVTLPGHLRYYHEIPAETPGAAASRVFRPPILVIDSLNVFKDADKEKFFETFLITGLRGTQMVVFVLDSHSAAEGHKYWEYQSDLVIRVDYTPVQDYYLRTIEIVKARFQGHVSGKHQLKIYEKPKSIHAATEDAKLYTFKRAHPFRTEGGIFIYPSIHYYLSTYKKSANKTHSASPASLSSQPEARGTPKAGRDFSTIMDFPVGRCSAFIGRRGGHKSHLGYFYLLDRILTRGERGIVISLRDDERMTEDTMQTIKEQEFLPPLQTPEKISELVEKGDLEILYYHPGYITPEEFFHRMFISIQQMKWGKKDGGITVLFNSLDQLAARFPLCAKQDIFVPGMVEMLTGEGITSVFIAVEEPGQPLEQYGLLPMADFIVSFSQCRFPTFEDYYHSLEGTLRFSSQSDEEYRSRVKMVLAECSKRRVAPEVVLAEVVRRAAGHPAGAKGIVELIEPDPHDGRQEGKPCKAMNDVGLTTLSGSLYPKPGLHFIPLTQGLDSVDEEHAWTLMSRSRTVGSVPKPTSA